MKNTVGIEKKDPHKIRYATKWDRDSEHTITVDSQHAYWEIDKISNRLKASTGWLNKNSQRYKVAFQQFNWKNGRKAFIVEQHRTFVIAR
jgi:hypothetical protein